jgi:hypothetical protein
VPLGPSAGFGLNLHSRDSERPISGALPGVGPHGLGLASFRVVVGLGRYRPEVRETGRLRRSAAVDVRAEPWAAPSFKRRRRSGRGAP